MWNTTVDTRANVGSSLFLKAVHQLAAIITRYLTANGLPFKYTPLAAEGVFQSEAAGANAAAQMMSIAKWNWAQDGMNNKMFPLICDILRLGNLPVCVRWKTNERKIHLSGKDGKPVKKMMRESYMTLEVLDHSSVYMDGYGGDSEHQQCVIVETDVPLHQLVERRKEWDKEAFQKLLDKRNDVQSDFASQKDHKEAVEENKGREYSPSGFAMYTVREVYAYVPIEGETWDDANEATLWRMTLVGSTIEDSICLRLDTEFEPDGEIPVRMIHAIPETNMAYHMLPAMTIRSHYSALCTFINLAIDNGVNINDPHLCVDTNRMFTTDLTKKVWSVSATVPAIGCVVGESSSTSDQRFNCTLNSCQAVVCSDPSVRQRAAA
jgi:hypothetical protein